MFIYGIAGYMVLGLKQEDAEGIFTAIRAEYEPETRDDVLKKAAEGAIVAVRAT